jgi:hypothetical protein
VTLGTTDASGSTDPRSPRAGAGPSNRVDERAGALDVLVFAAGAGAIGDYSECAWVVEGTGQFRPGAEARPTIGQTGALERVPEHRAEVVLPRSRRRAVVAALRAAHPYEEPAFHLIETADPDADPT